MKTSYIDINLIDKITVSEKTNTGILWYEKTNSVPIRFLGIKCGETKGTPEGWGWRRLSTQELLDFNPNYMVDEENKVVYSKPKVSIRLTNGEYFDRYFDTDDEAEDYAFEINSESGKNLFALNHK